MRASRFDWRLLALVACFGPLGSLLTLLAFEVFLHWRQNDIERFHDLNTRFDAELGWAPIESRQFRTSAGPVTSNRLGFRSRELDPDALQIAVLGDSVAWGWGVGDGASLAWRLDERFAPQGYQVSNLAVAGYGLDQYLLSFDRHAPGLPRLAAVLAVITTADDLTSSMTNSAFGKRKPLFELRGGQLARRAEAIRHYGLRNLRSHSFVLLSLERSPLGPALRAALDPWTGDVALPRETGEAVGRALLAALAERAEARGARFVALLVPARDDFPEPRADHRWFAEQCRALALDCLDAQVALARARNPNTEYLDAVHLSESGLARLADFAAAPLAERLASGEGRAAPPE